MPNGFTEASEADYAKIQEALVEMGLIHVHKRETTAGAKP
jgi:hypothetical protein